MACRLTSAKPLSEPMLEYCKLEHWSFHLNTTILIQENAFENVVWEMTAILSRPQFIKLRMFALQMLVTFI